MQVELRGQVVIVTGAGRGIGKAVAIASARAGAAVVLVSRTEAQLQAVAPGDVREVRAAPPLVQFSDPMRRASTELKQFLLRNLYRHAQVMATTNQARRIVRELFAAYMEVPQSMQPGFVARSEAARDDLDEVQSRARVVADFIAGMTDRFAVREHERITGVRLLA